MIGMNPSRVAVGSPEPVLIEGDDVVIVSAAVTDLLQDLLEQLWDELKVEAVDLCTGTVKTDLPPLRAVNHTIPLIDEKTVLLENGQVASSDWGECDAYADYSKTP
ncbi:hypothetical protein AZE42_13600 [Rhizopogon vesiculosus]|uniref:Uncharacterized protein n=1 Tax=Rhizopogon vesiculosus TaxID=180088 RepID=A0A1J8QEE5_9AGAM|nr:hypothetical protein AZE42_13600 [Rhizopogon vesiculosus]